MKLESKLCILGEGKKCIRPEGRPEECSPQSCPVYKSAIRYAEMLAGRGYSDRAATI